VRRVRQLAEPTKWDRSLALNRRSGTSSERGEPKVRKRVERVFGRAIGGLPSTRSCGRHPGYLVAAALNLLHISKLGPAPA
jgi:hypothetical protein